MSRLFFLFILCATTSSAQDYTLANIYTKLEIKKDSFISKPTDENILKIAYRLDSTFQNTGNPKENLSFQFLNPKTGFAYGNEVGYGVWPFLYKTTDGGETWTNLFFEDHQYGDPLMKEHFFMFDENRGILIQKHWVKTNFLLRAPNGRFYYYITKDGGQTWKKKSKKLKTMNPRYENDDHFLKCEFNSKGEVSIYILRPPWASGPDKREIKERILLELRSDDFGNHFSENNPHKD